ncbi:MAG: putative thioredoxin [Bacteroidetes bacterium]|nr:putative thioredoxin [Bacteroidota bacterium]
MHQRQNIFARGAGIVCAVFFAGSIAVDYWPSNSSLTWLSLDEAQTSARESNKPVFLDIYAEWCPPCKQMERFVFPDDSVQDLLTRKFTLAKVNLDDPVWGDSVKKRFQVRAIPTYIVLAPNGREIKRHVGFFEKSAFIKWLGDSHMLILSWRSFEKARAQGEFLGKRLLVLVTADSENFEKLNSLIDTPGARRIIDSLFVPTLLTRTNKSDEMFIAQLGAAKTRMDEIIVLDGEKEIGRFVISPDMYFNENRFLQKLSEISEDPATLRGRVAPQRRISLSSSQ